MWRQITKNIKYIISLVLLGILFSGCGSHFRKVHPNEKLENSYVSVKVPNTDWKISKKFKTKDISIKDTWGISLYNETPKGAQYKIHVKNSLSKNYLMYFDKNFDTEKFNKDYYERKKANFRERGIKFAKSDTQYIKGMKCDTSVQVEGNIAYIDSGIRKLYQAKCGYYDTKEKNNDGRRLLNIYQVFSYYSGRTRLQKDKNTPSNKIKSRAELEIDFKIQVKQLIDSLEIKNFDIERMKKEGLYHPHKKYEHMKW